MIAKSQRGRPQAASGSETAERIRQAAMKLFHNNGFVASTVREIAEACDLTPGAIYNHFGSKHEILYSIVRRSHDELEREVADAIAVAPDGARAKLRAALVAFTLRHTLFPEAARVTNRDYGFLREPERRKVIGLRRKLRALIQDLVQDGIDEGVMAVPAPEGGRRADGLATEIVAMDLINMSVMVAEWYRPKGPLSSQAIAEFQADVALQMVTTAARAAPNALANGNARTKARS
jgi:AcrR family transcriptional regulator